mmetsp:Transcript_61127/g.137981  ORF Transcript_61127/g.137981 Transcript_61127/m.137981 type:complete len:180 (+) Transcript_61127:62-601(+)
MGASWGAVVGAVLHDCRVSVRHMDGYEEPGVRTERLEGMMEELFRLHDLDKNGTLEEVELVKLNEKISILHQGVDADTEAVRQRYSGIFRAEFDADGRPVPYSTFRKYMFRMLDSLDPDEPTQAMIMDQFIAEADLALAHFPGSLKIRPGILAALPKRQLAQSVPSPDRVARGVGIGGG